MKKFLFLLPFLLIINACADYDVSSSNNSDNGLNNNIIHKNGILALGYNQINMQLNKTLYTAVYLNNKNANEDNAFYSLESDNSLPVNNNIYYKTKENNNSNKIKLTEYLKDFQQFTKDNNIKAINNESNINTKTIPNNIQVGSLWDNVYVLDIESNQYKQINAKCIAVSEYAYFFLDSSVNNLEESQIQALKTSFDKDYKIIHQYFGKENDIDKNGKVVFLITNLPNNIMGFFSSVDKYFNKDLQGTSYKSNESDMLYVNAKYFQADIWKQEKTNVLATFIHEFQHMTFFDTRTNQKLNTENARWLNEGLSMLAEYYGGYGNAHYGYLYSYFERFQGVPLVTESTSLDYGYSYLFTRYINERCGASMIKSIYISQYTGKEAVGQVCQVDFDTLYEDFVKMVLYTGRGITSDTKYNIEAFNYPKSSVGYKQNGFNLSELIDTVISSNRNNDEFLTTYGYNKSISNYSFVITKWVYNDIYLRLISKNNNIKGFYGLW